ncbi:NAD(P)/FAD-dependent oxidoreductase [Ekhidna sp.]
MDNNDFEVIIIGGSYAGLSASLTLGRSLRKTLIMDAGKPCNRQTPHSHNFLTQDGSTPEKISNIAKLQVSKYDTIRFYEGFANSGKKTSRGFEIINSDGDTFTTKKIVIATGIKDLIPSITGFADCWGISVIHCPYCHGYEFKNQKTAILANGDSAFHLAPLVHNLTKESAILTSGKPTFDKGQSEKLKMRNIRIMEKEVVEITHENGQVKTVVFKDSSKESFDAVYAPIPFEQSSDIPVSLGCELTEQGYIKVDSMQKTNINGVFACGDNSTMMRSVATAVYGGNIAGAAINKELTEESF